MPQLFYKNCSEENCVSYVSHLFQSLGNREEVSASLAYFEGGSEATAASYPDGVSSKCMMEIHNHLDSSNIWKKTVPWVTEVEYTIPHPNGDVTAFDTKSGGDAQLSRKSVALNLTGSCLGNENWRIYFSRISAEPSDKMDFNTTRYSWVKVMNIKRFFYETNRSSWIFKLVVCWEGVTVEDAKKGDKKYFVYVETNDNMKMSSNPPHSAASFLDKILDIISLGGRRQILTVLS